MGMSQPFRSSASWDQAVEMLDMTFPLAEGSHGSAADYLVYLEHLLVIRADGSCTGLARPGQFVEAGGNEESPQSILLEQGGLQVEIEPERRCPEADARREHRLQLLTSIAAT